MKILKTENKKKSVAAIGFLVTVVVVIDMIYRKYKKCLASFNSDTVLDIDDECLCDEGECCGTQSCAGKNVECNYTDEQPEPAE